MVFFGKSIFSILFTTADLSRELLCEHACEGKCICNVLFSCLIKQLIIKFLIQAKLLALFFSKDAEKECAMLMGLGAAILHNVLITTAWVKQGWSGCIIRADYVNIALKLTVCIWFVACLST